MHMFKTAVGPIPAYTFHPRLLNQTKLSTFSVGRTTFFLVKKQYVLFLPLVSPYDIVILLRNSDTSKSKNEYAQYLNSSG